MNTMSYVKYALISSALAAIVACAPTEEVAAPQQTIPSVPVASVIHQNLTEWDEFTGRLEAPESVNLRPRVSGYVADVILKEGAIVRAGDLLFQIDERSFRAEVERLDAQLSSAESQLALASSHYKRAKQLSSQNAIADQILDDRLANYRQARAAVKSVTAALELARLNHSYTQVKAPIDGRVSNAIVTKGNYVTAGQTQLTTIVSTDTVYAYFDADEQTYLNYVKLAKDGSRPSSRDVKNPVYMALANELDYPHEGYIDFVDNRVDPRTGTIRGRAIFDNADGEFIPGLFARIKLIGSASYQGILIDDKAIGTDLNNKFVLIVDENNVVQYRGVTLGEKLGGLRIISSGLDANDKIVVNGLQRVRPGAEIFPEVVNMATNETLENLQAMQERIEGSTGKQRFAKRVAETSLNVVGG